MHIMIAICKGIDSVLGTREPLGLKIQNLYYKAHSMSVCLSAFLKIVPP